MNHKLSNLIIFAAGAALGSVVTYKVVKTKYDQIIREVLDSMSESRGCQFLEDVSEDEVYREEDEADYAGITAIDQMRAAYNNIAQDAGYTEGYLENKEDESVDYPYVITPDDFDTLDGYGTESLNYYADGVLTDQFDNVIDYPEEIIGDIDPADHFGEYEEDTVHVRNDVTKCDYEILRDTRNFSDVYPS